MKGQDVVYKDVIEHLESVSVSITPTEKKTIEEYGPPAEVRHDLLHVYRAQRATRCYRSAGDP